MSPFTQPVSLKLKGGDILSPASQKPPLPLALQSSETHLGFLRSRLTGLLFWQTLPDTQAEKHQFPIEQRNVLYKLLIVPRLTWTQAD